MWGRVCGGGGRGGEKWSELVFFPVASWLRRPLPRPTACPIPCRSSPGSGKSHSPGLLGLECIGRGRLEEGWEARGRVSRKKKKRPPCLFVTAGERGARGEGRPAPPRLPPLLYPSRTGLSGGEPARTAPTARAEANRTLESIAGGRGSQGAKKKKSEKGGRGGERAPPLAREALCCSRSHSLLPPRPPHSQGEQPARARSRPACQPLPPPALSLVASSPSGIEERERGEGGAPRHGAAHALGGGGRARHAAGSLVFPRGGGSAPGPAPRPPRFPRPLTPARRAGAC